MSGASGFVVSCGVRLSEVGFSEFRKPQVARSIRVAGPSRRDEYPLYSVLPLDFAYEVITSESSDHKKGNDLSRSVLLVGHNSI